MLEKNPMLVLVLAVCAALCVGFGVGYVSKPVPEPVISVKPLLKAPWLEISVNGKPVDLSKVKFGPEEKKRWWGEGEGVPPAAGVDRCPCVPLCECNSCSCNAIPVSFQTQPASNNRGGGGTEWLGLDRVVDRLIAWLSDKGKETEAALARREQALSKGWENVKTAAIVIVAVGCIPLLWIGYSLQRIAGKSG